MGERQRKMFSDQRQTRTHNEKMKEKEASFGEQRVLRHASQELTTSEVSVEEKGMITALGKRLTGIRETHIPENKSCHSLSPIPY